MAKREKLPDIMGEAIGRLKITEAVRPAKLVSLGVGLSEEPERLIRDLKGLRLNGMARVYQDQAQSREIPPRGFEELLDQMLQEEAKDREERRRQTRVRQANLSRQVGLADVDLHLDRGLDRSYFLWLARGEWLKTGDNLIISGPVGVGKTFLGSALARHFCLAGGTAYYTRIFDLWSDLTTAKEKHAYDRLRRRLGRVDLLILDDWALTEYEEWQKQELMSVLDDRYGHRSTLVISPLAPGEWPENGSSSAMDRSILDRLLNQAHYLNLKGRSVRSLFNRKSARA